MLIQDIDLLIVNLHIVYIFMLSWPLNMIYFQIRRGSSTDLFLLVP